MTASVTSLDEPPQPQGRTPRQRLFIGLLAAVIVAAVLVALAAVVIVSRIDAGRHTKAAPLGDTTAASVDITGGVTSLTVRTADLDSDLYRISTPGDSAQLPLVATSST